METFFAWYNLIFTIPLVVGMLFMVGIATGLGDTDDADFDGDHGNVFSTLGFGRCPAIVVIASLLLVYGAVGWTMNYLLGPLIAAFWPFVGTSFVCAAVVSFFLTGFLARTYARFVPTTETRSLTNDDMVGSSGKLILDADATSGLGMFLIDGDVHQLAVVSGEGRLQKGTHVVIMDYDVEIKRHVVYKEPA